MSHTENQDVTYYSGHVIEVNGKRYAPERTCNISYEYDGVPFFHPIHVHELTCGHAVRLFEDVPRYCPYCGARVVDE